MHQHDKRSVRNARDAFEIAHEVEGQIVCETVRRDHPLVDCKERVSIRRRAMSQFDRDVAARARAIIDEERLPESLGNDLTG